MNKEKYEKVTCCHCKEYLEPFQGQSIQGLNCGGCYASDTDRLKNFNPLNEFRHLKIIKKDGFLFFKKDLKEEEAKRSKVHQEFMNDVYDIASLGTKEVKND